eukprot:1709001-Amphidinium_carterae.1
MTNEASFCALSLDTPVRQHDCELAPQALGVVMVMRLFVLPFVLYDSLVLLLVDRFQLKVLVDCNSPALVTFSSESFSLDL